jgi:ribosomal protein S12 methylthiotransferase
MVEKILSAAPTVHFVSLGCSKNLVDSQVMLGYLGLGGYVLCEDPAQAEVIVVNTCSFVWDAKEESVNTILELSDYKDPANGVCKILVVAGCLAQRYSEEIEKDIPEIDLIIGTGEYHKITQLLGAINEGALDRKSFVEYPRYIHTDLDPRLNTSPAYMAWLKISEGCNRKCTFCIIPQLRGRLRSRKIDSLVREATKLARDGVKELNLISQDLSRFGVDTEESLIGLLKALEEIEGVRWIRLYYYYPDDLDDQMISFLASSKKICPYLDMPVQHFSNRILKRMNREITGEEILERVAKLRSKIPGMVIRTSLIVGFPGESEEDFQTLLAGVEEAKFDHLGVFRYSDEEGTPASKLEGKVAPEVIEERFEQVYELQQRIVQEINQSYIGRHLEVLVEGPHEETDLLYQGRFIGQAPDIDGKVIINDTEIPLKAGDFVEVKISEVLAYDFVGAVIRPI